MRLVVKIAVVLLPLAGCGAPPPLTYNGRPAQTAAECEAAKKDAKGSVPVVYGGGVPVAATLAGVVIGASINADRRQTQYEACLAQVASNEPGKTLPYVPQPVADAPASTQPATKPVQSAPTGSCTLTMTGGSGYACLAN